MTGYKNGDERRPMDTCGSRRTLLITARRYSMLARYMLSSCVCPSVTKSRSSTKMA